MNCIDVPQETLDETTWCHESNRCLIPGELPLCRVVRTLRGNGVQVSRVVEAPCLYVMQFGIDNPHFVCNCPTRNEIHRRYGM
ncbi:hypothetical protein ACFLU3_04490 [Chloroflexota bacterium]